MCSLLSFWTNARLALRFTATLEHILEHLFSPCSKCASRIQNPDTESLGTKHIQEKLEEMIYSTAILKDFVKSAIWIKTDSVGYGLFHDKQL